MSTSMEKSLIEAANEGDTQKLHDLIDANPFLLRATTLAECDNPLHIACIGGHVDFAKQVLSLCPDFAHELNPDGLSPLHIASARGDIVTVKELLKLGTSLCLVKGKEKRIPLHHAVAKGRINVVELLMSASLDSAKEVTARGESCFHLAVKNNQFEAFEVLCERMVFGDECILNVKDEQGNTILHLAASRKIYEVVDLLLDEKFVHKDKLEVNILNKNGLTPLDVLISEAGGDPDIEEMLRLSGAVRNQEINAPQQNPSPEVPPHNNQSGQEQRRRRRRPKFTIKELEDYFMYDVSKESPREARNTLLVVAVLIMTATYQGVLSPPGGLWQDFPPVPDNTTVASGNSSITQSLMPGQSVLGALNLGTYANFMFFNTLGFYTAMLMMLILTHGFPMQSILRCALFAVTMTFDICRRAISPRGVVFEIFLLLPGSMLVVVWIFSTVRDCMKKRRRRRQTELQSTRENV